MSLQKNDQLQEDFWIAFPLSPKMEEHKTHYLETFQQVQSDMAELIDFGCQAGHWKSYFHFPDIHPSDSEKGSARCTLTISSPHNCILGELSVWRFDSMNNTPSNSANGYEGICSFQLGQACTLYLKRILSDCIFHNKRLFIVIVLILLFFRYIALIEHLLIQPAMVWLHFVLQPYGHGLKYLVVCWKVSQSIHSALGKE